MIRKTALSMLLLIVGAANAFADGKLYRWVDANGGVHYGDQPVGSAQEVEPKSVQSAKSTDTTAAQAPLAPGGASAEECQRKRDQLGSYRTAGKVSETDGLGNTRDYTPEEKQKLIEITEKSVHDLCGNS